LEFIVVWTERFLVSSRSANTSISYTLEAQQLGYLLDGESSRQPATLEKVNFSHIVPSQNPFWLIH
jgi:hypothetical protein